jgi:acylphosphatase
MIRAHVVVKGRVQGVWYRQSTLEQAVTLGLAGWVRNLRGGEVEAVFEGEDAAVEEMVAWCRRGPPLAQVTELDVQRGAPEGLRPPFKVRPTE